MVALAPTPAEGEASRQPLQRSARQRVQTLDTMVNGFDLQAVGWVVTRDVCWEAVRTFLGLRTRLPGAMFGELGRRWESVQRSAGEDWNRMDCWTRLLQPRRAPLSRRTEEALGAFVEQLAVSCPDRYGSRALLRRSLDVLGRVAGVALCAFLVQRYAPAGSPALAPAELAFVLIGGWSVAVAIQLWQVYALARRFATAPQPRRSASRTSQDG